MKRHWRMAWLGLMFLAVWGAWALPLSAQPAQPPETHAAKADPQAVPVNVRRLLQDRKYAEAVAAIDQALAGDAAPSGADRERLEYLKGRALHLAQRYDAAIEAFEQLEARSPDSSWARRARFGRAVSLARKGDFQAAELIYRQQAAELLSLDRKQEIADVYLEFARAWFQPADEHQPPDYAKALEFFGKALEVGPQPDQRAEVELLVARCHQAMGNHQEAIRLFDQFSKDHSAGPLEVEARFRLGESHLALSQREEARRVWQDLLADYPDDKSERIAEAAFNLSLTYNIPKPQSDDELTLGVAALESFLKRYPDHKLASQAHLRIAASYIERGRHEDAVKSLERFLADERYAQADEVPDARNLLGRSYQLQKKFSEALAAWRDYLAKHPAHSAWSDVQREIINTEFLLGYDAREARRYEAARKLWAEFLAKYPLDPRNPAILYEFGHMEYRQERWEEAIAEWRRLVSKYPDTNESSQAQFMIAVTLEEKLGKLQEALKEFRKVTWGNHGRHAQLRIARLTAKDLAIATERVFRTNETPRIKLATRNIDKVTVRAYTVDLETYFRKMHLAGGVEALDIALIDPDRTFEFEVPKYAEYQQLENEIELPLPPAGEAGAAPAGVMAVTVSSTTLEATTLVVQSDLDMIVKSSRDEVFVFAENMRTGKPWPGARLLISNGQQVFAEGRTGDDGVFQKAYQELKGAADVRVFAVADFSVASSVVGLDGVGVAQGLTDRGYIYTDRSAYRAGQLVHVRGIVRTASGDVFGVEPGKKYHLDVFDGRNRLIRQDEVALGEFGSFHVHFVLPAGSVPGSYRIQVRDDDNHSYQGGFTVHEYQLEPVRLAVETERKVFYRGEEIEGTITARFYYGAPVAGRLVRYQLAGGRVYEGQTDAKGELAFKLATREFRESQALPLVVTLPERNLQTTEQFYLATQGFSIGVSTVRPVYLAGETFEVAIATRDAEGKPSGQQLALTVLERTVVDRKTGEREVERHEVATDAKDGRARVTLRLEKGATYVLRVEGTDRFDNPVAAAHLVQISDDNDTVRLRILADKHTFKVGDTANVQLHWREAPALALVTFQGARVLDYRLVELAEGANELAIPMSMKLSPNFELWVAVMTDAHPPRDPEKLATFTRFHSASSPFTVERELKVVIEPKAKGEGNQEIRPGDEIEVAITTTDPQGKPVAAELSLALIEQSLWEMFGSNVPPIQEFFRGQTREPAVRSTASVTFAYRPATLPINPRLLAEKDRLEIEALTRERINAGIALSSQRGGFAGAAGGVQEFTGRDAGAMSADDAAQPDFEALIELITPPLAPKAWDDMDGDGPVQEFEGNLSLEISQTQEVRKSGVVAPGGFSADVDVPFNQTMLGGQVYPVGDLVVPTRADKGPADFRYAAPNAAEFRRYAGRREVGVLFSDGRQANLRLGDMDENKAAALADELTKAGAVLLPPLGAHETGYWNPAVVTDAEGKAIVTLAVPDRSTAWKILVKGITGETLAGQAEGELVVKKDFFGELKLPLAFTDGDEAEVLATVHNDAAEQGALQVTLRTTIGGRVAEERKTLEAGKGIHELSFKVSLRRPDAERAAGGEEQLDQDADTVHAVFELAIAAGERRDVTRRAVPLEPYGMRVFATAGGSAASDTTAFVEPPAEMPLTSAALEIVVGPTVERSLLDVVLAPATAYQIDCLRVASGLDTAVSDLMAAVALQKLLGTTREAGGPEAEALDSRIRGSLSLLVASQADDGGWSWTGAAGASNRYTSSRVVWALSLAKRAGYAVPDEAYEKAIRYLSGQVVATADTDYESKAILLQALAAAGRGDFTLANRLHRNRPSLSNAALAWLALALVEMDRQPMAAEILDLLAKRNLDQSAAKRRDPAASLPWSHAAAEIRAVYLLSLQQVAAQDPRTRELVDWLLAHRTGHRWTPDKATGPATLALGQWYAQRRFETEHYKLTVLVNGFEAGELEITADSVTQRLLVPAKLLAEGKQRIQFQLAGRGRFTYQCVLSGFVPAEQLKSTTQDWQVRRHYEPAPRELDGEMIPRGFGVLQGSYTAFRNPLTQLPVAQRGQVELQIWRHNVPANTPEEHLEYLVVTEPLPAGATVVEQSVQGGFERFEISPGSITFYVGSRQYVEPIRFDIHGYLPGSYRVAPTVVRNPYRPEQLAVAEPRPLAVLPLGAAGGDEYKLTPQELYEYGKRQFARGRFQSAGVYLTELVSKWQLQPEVYRDAARMLLDVHLETGPDAAIVRYFELIKEKWPDVEIPFDKIVKVGAAYHEIGEYERSYLVFRATIEGSFQGESGVAGFLESQGELLRSVEFMTGLLAAYPPEPYVAAAEYALAQRVYAYAPQAASDPKLREEKITRIDLVSRAMRMLDDFLTVHPQDPAADQASFSLANALLELKAFREAIERCGQYAERYPDSDFLDSYWYIIGYSHFALGEHEQALAMCRKVAETKRTNRQTGQEQESVNKWRAIYILGQVYHSLGKAADAIREYTRVEDRFADAKQAIAYFLRKEITLPEVTTVRPGEPAELELKFRNVARCDSRVYKIDLMKFSLLKRNLGGITAINLAGIRPLHEALIELGDGLDYRDRTHKLALPLKDEGAYLVVCRGDDLHASGLVLVTPLSVEVQEEPSSGQVRATVKNVEGDSYVPEVHVKAIGTRNSDFVSGDTDLRGVFVAEGLLGTSTVIAQAGDHRYAFFRGQTELGPGDPAAEPANQQDAPAEAQPAAPNLLEGLDQHNRDIQQRQEESLKSLYQQNKKGILPSEAF